MDTKAGKIGDEHKAEVVRSALLGLLALAIVFLLVAQFAAPSKVIVGEATGALTLIAGPPSSSSVSWKAFGRLWE